MSANWIIRKCRNKRCRGSVTPAHHSPTCSKCKSRAWREKNPVKAKFSDLKNRAKQRGHTFLLTIEQFSEFVARTDYMEKRGKSATSLSIDRIRPHIGYQADNIRVLTLSTNSRLRNAPLEVCERYAALAEYSKNRKRKT